MVLDPFGLAPGLPELVWDPIDGCVDPMVAERRAKAFTAGTVKGAVAGGHADDAARFYAAEAAKVLQAYFHAAALTGRSLEDVLRWVAKPLAATDPTEILREHPHAAPVLARPAPRGAARRRPDRRQHHHHRAAGDEPVLPGRHPPPLRPRTGAARHRHRRGHRPRRHDLPARPRGPLRLGVAADDRGRRARPRHRPRWPRNASPWGRLCPPMLACLDELPSTAPLPTLRTRMANERALGISLHLGRAGLAPAGRDLRGAGGPDPARA